MRSSCDGCSASSLGGGLSALRLGSGGSALAANALADRPRGPAVPTSPADQARLMLVTPGIEGLDGQNVGFSYICE